MIHKAPKVAEHSFQVPMPNIPLLMIWRPFFAGVKVNHRRVNCRILVKVYAVAMATGLAKTRLKKCFLFVYEKSSR